MAKAQTGSSSLVLGSRLALRARMHCGEQTLAKELTTEKVRWVGDLLFLAIVARLAHISIMPIRC